MKKALLILITISLSFTGCSSDSDSDSNNTSPENNLRLVKIVETDLMDNSTQTINYTYLNNVVVKSEEREADGTVHKNEYIYEGQNLIKINHFRNSIPTGNNTFTYTGNKITSSLSYEDNIYFLHNYTYNSRGFMINEKQYSDNQLDSSDDYEHDNNGNITKRTYPSGYLSFEYDSKRNPYSLLFPEAIMKIYGQGFSLNNITKEIWNDGSATTRTYTYNTGEYPAEEIQSYNGRLQRKINYYYE